MLQNELVKHGIGDTVFKRSRNIEILLKYSKIYLKFEGGNPTGTMKDRAAYNCLKEAKKKGYEALAIGSCGNFGASFVHLAKIFGLTPHVQIPAHYHTPRIAEMEKKGGILHRIPGTYEDAVAASSRDAKEHGWYDANPGVEPNTRLSLEAYATMSYEIFESLGYAPDVVASPVGNGTTLAGLFHGFKDLLTQGKIKKIPFMVASSTIGGNPVVKCFLDGESEIRQLKPNEIIETDVNEPLVSWISLDGQEALDALHGSSGWATYITDQEMVEYSEIMAREEGLLVLPASASSLVALNKYINEKSLKSGKSLVALLTSRKY